VRLINLKTYELKEFIDSERPPYVILSHTWEAEEVSLQKLHSQGVEKMAGYKKIRSFCRQGTANGFEWGWVDACCIDKTSSAELSEAINSMYKWYQEAEVCYAYLRDVHRHDGDLFSSRWFRRGWTLQELLASSSVVFYVQDWAECGTKTALQQTISRITNIPQAVIGNHKDANSFGVAQKMSWAAGRQTTHPEDMSYCLLGILGVNMPLLYGEGPRAFVRLQEEVMKIGIDPSIFAWPSSLMKHSPTYWTSFLASSPAAFKNAGDVVAISHTHGGPTFGPYSMTNKGVRIENLPMVDESLVKS
jgi:hypothetical protein